MLSRSIQLVFVLSLLVAGVASAQESTLVYPGASGFLVYKTQPDGDRIIDFSAVGFMHGNEPIPFIPMAVTVTPGPGDDTARIQNAIDVVSSMQPNAEGFRGAVVLAPGEFQVATQLRISSSGVVLRGAGDDMVGGTVIRATGTTQRSLIVVTNATDSGSGSTSGSTAQVIDKYVPVGATSFRVDNASSFAVGDRVLITRPGTAEWIADLGMDQIPPRDDGGTINQWSPSSYNLTFERGITAIDGERVFLDIPITNELAQRYGGGTMRRYAFSNRVTKVGVEHLRGVSDYDISNPEDEAHAWSFVEFRRVENGWIRGVTGQHFGYATAFVNERSRLVTVEDAVSLDPISRVAGGRRYPFVISRSALVLMQHLYSESGRHDFVINSRSEGPNVFRNGAAVDARSDTGPHQRWSTGALFDNITVQGDRINVRNRGNFGSGHGWAGANMVVWNSDADGYIMQSPPTAQNWLIGSVGQVLEETRFGQQPPAIIDAHGSPVATNSLYQKQLLDRQAIPGQILLEYVMGDYDDYANDGPASVDDVAPTPDFLAEFGGYLSTRPTKGLDDGAADEWVPLAWEFQVEPGCRVYRAVLTISMRRTGGRTRNDSLWFERFENRLYFDADLGLTEELDNSESTTITLEIFGVDASYLNDGRFNVLIGEDVSIDWARLDVFQGTLLPADINADAVVNESDLIGFLELAESSDPRAETTGDMPAGVDFFDVLSFLSDFEASTR